MRKLLLFTLFAMCIMTTVKAQSPLGYQSAFGMAYGAKYKMINDGDFFFFFSI